MGTGERKEKYMREGCWQEFLEIREVWKDAGLKPVEYNARAEAEIEWKFFDGDEPPRYRDDEGPRAESGRVASAPAEASRWEEVTTDDVPQSVIVKWVMMQFIAAQEIKSAGGHLVNQLIDLDPPPPNRAALGMLKMAAEDKDFIFEVYRMAAKMITGDVTVERMYDDGSDASAETLQKLADEATTGSIGERSLADPLEVSG